MQGNVEGYWKSFKSFSISFAFKELDLKFMQERKMWEWKTFRPLDCWIIWTSIRDCHKSIDLEFLIDRMEQDETTRRREMSASFIGDFFEKILQEIGWIFWVCSMNLGWSRYKSKCLTTIWHLNHIGKFPDPISYLQHFTIEI